MRGCQKKMLLLKGTDSTLFEEAYFIMRDTEAANLHERDLIAEACRIIESNDMRPPQKYVRLSRRRKLAFFLYGALSVLAADILLLILHVASGSAG
ncbi:MAG: hypothetical protein ACI4WZ_02110 [Eubacteriales bacterium]